MKKNQMLLLLVFVFALPIIIAKLVLEMQWYQGGVTNKGQLLSSPQTVEWLAKTKKWQLVYWLPTDCNARCRGALFNLRQVPLAIGADKDRVNSLVVVSKEIDERGKEILLLQGIPQHQIHPSAANLSDQLEYGRDAIYLSDPNGNVMMAYPLVEGESAILAQGKDLLKDLKRLLKVSKVG